MSTGLSEPAAAIAHVEVGGKAYRVVLLRAGRLQVWEGERRVMDGNEELAAIFAVSIGMATKIQLEKAVLSGERHTAKA